MDKVDDKMLKKINQKRDEDVMRLIEEGT